MISIGTLSTGGFPSSSYITPERAQMYFNTRLNTEAWDDASYANRIKALTTATRLIDNLRFRGCKTLSTQSLEFPRNNETEIPIAIEIATCECALALLDDMDLEIEINNLSTASDNYATVQTTYNRNITQEHIVAGIPSAIAWRYLKPFLIDPNAVLLRHI